MSATVKRGRALINAQALLGTMLGNNVLQQLVGQGGMGAVFLAQQEHPSRSVALKVLSPPTVQTQNQRVQFLERFRQEINAISSLEHANIVPIYTYGAQDGLAYLTMPYITGGTLRNILESQKFLQFSVIASYLDQLASALDYAHQQGVIHRDLRPANVLIHQEGHLLLTDFGLVKIATERHTSQMRLLKSATPIGSLEYMAPEQIMGDVMDARTDLYALGVILYQMVTGQTPFSGGTPLQIATQLVQSAPPSPRHFRTELPIAAEQVLLQALVKRSQDRYARCQDFANAFCAALTAAGLLSQDTSISSPTSNSAILTPSNTRQRGLFDPIWQHSPTEASPVQSKATKQLSSPLSGATPLSTIPVTQLPKATPALLSTPISEQGIDQADLTAPATPQATAPTRMRQGLRNSLLRSASASTANTTAPVTPQTQTVGTIGNGFVSASPSSITEQEQLTSGTASAMPEIKTPITPPVPSLAAKPIPSAITTTPPAFIAPSTDLPPSQSSGNGTWTLPMQEPGQSMTGTLTVPDPASPFPSTTPTGTLMVPGSEQGMVKLTGAMKVVQVPIAGQPGRYVTGLLPMLPPEQQHPQNPPTETPLPVTRKPTLTRLQKGIALALTLALICFIPGIFLFVHSRPPSTDKSGLRGEVFTPDLSAIYASRATATANANYILSDPLTQNIHNWPIADSGYKVYRFTDGAYHVLDNDPNQSAPAILPGVTLTGPMVYTLSLDEIKGDDSSPNNSFGMIFRFTSQPQGNQNIVTFYSFEVVNTHGGAYQFWKYDNSKGRAAHPWTAIWQHTFGGEFHQGQGPKNNNTFKIIANGKNFTFLINGKKVGTAQDASLTSGEIGVLVNLKGTEVAFSNLSLTYN